MRILLGIARLRRGGGTETHVITLAHELRQMGHDVVVYTSGGPWVKKVRRLGMVVYTYAHHSTASHGHRNQPSLRRLLRHEDFDLLHAHDALSLRRFSEAARRMQEPPKIVFTVHGPYVGEAAIQYARTHADAMISVSHSMGHSILASIPRGKVTIVPNGIRTDVFHPSSGNSFRTRYHIAHSAFVVGYCGRFTFDKVVLGKRIVSSLWAFAAQHPDVHVVVAGRGSMSAIASTKRVHVAGHVEAVPSFLNACDVVVGTGRTAVESLSCQVPVVAVGKAGYAGIVTVDNLGEMVRTNFADHGATKTWTSDRLHRSLRRVYAHPDRYQKQARLLRKAMQQRFGSGRMADQTLRVYRRLV